MLLSINTSIIDKPITRRGFNKGFVAQDLTVEELISHIESGHAFSAKFADETRNSRSFDAAGFLAADIDEGMTLAEAEADSFIQKCAAFLYTTPSHTNERNRFRVVFELAEPIRDGSQYTAALTGLINRLGGDRACKDPARIFFGSRSCTVRRFGNTLPIVELRALIASARLVKSQSKTVAAKGTNTSTDPPLKMQSVVKRADGSEASIEDFTPEGNRSIHCPFPFHQDRHASACVVFSQSGSIGVYCNKCAKRVWVKDAQVPVDFDWHLPYEKKAAEYLENWHDRDMNGAAKSTVPQFIANDGTNVWLYDQKHLQAIPFHPGLTFIRSPKGTGKTVQLTAIVSHFKQHSKKILVVGHRRTLLRSLANRLGLPYYLSPGARDDLADTGSIVVSLDSLHKVVEPHLHKFDVILIDESEQVVSHCASETLAKQRLQTLDLLEHLIRRSNYVICADADMGLLTSGFFLLLQDKGRPDNLVLNRYVQGSRGNEAGSNCVNDIDLYTDKKALQHALVSDVIQGKRCFVACNSITHAKSIFDGLTTIAPEKRLLLITAKTSRLKTSKAFIHKPAVEALKYDVVICSPALSTGIDISFPNDECYFDRVYGFFRDGVTTHFEVDQQLARVRHPGGVRVWVSATQRHYECDPSVIYEELVRSRDAAQVFGGYTPDGRLIYRDNKALELMAWIWHLRRSSLVDLKNQFISLKEQNGWNVKQVSSTEHHLSWDKSARLCDSYPKSVSEALDITKDRYNWLRTYERGFGVTVEQDAQMRKYELRECYGVQVISPDLVILDNGGRFAQKYWNLNYLYLGDAGLLKADKLEMEHSRKSSVDWSKRALKKQLIERLLSAAGLYERSILLAFDQTVSKRSLGPFIDAVFDARKDIEQLLGLSVRDGDIREKPVLQLRDILDVVGMKLGEKRRKIVDGERTDFYSLDVGHWEHVAKHCGLNRSFGERQILLNQVEIGISDAE